MAHVVGAQAGLRRTHPERGSLRWKLEPGVGAGGQLCKGVTWCRLSEPEQGDKDIRVGRVDCLEVLKTERSVSMQGWAVVVIGY